MTPEDSLTRMARDSTVNRAAFEEWKGGQCVYAPWSFFKKKKKKSTCMYLEGDMDPGNSLPFELIPH